MNYSVLLVHSDSPTRRSARHVLETAGYSVTDSEELHLSDFGSPDVLLLEWLLLIPLNESLRWLRSHDQARDARILLLADRADMASAISALEQGADDCLPTPFEHEELLIRVSTSLRRPQVSLRRDNLRVGPVELDPGRHQVRVAGKPVELAPTEFRLMTFLLEHHDRVFSREELLNRAWSRNVKAGPRTVDVHVRRLRQQLEPFGCEDMIQTVRGFGYRLRTSDVN